jgi:formylglycine-generating enzyme required for sulfatase activity
MNSEADAVVARDRIERFVRRFGEPYRRLAWYAALPLILTPEILDFLRLHFLGGRDGVPWIAEADLLLSDLCRPVGYEQFALDQPVRACLVAAMRAKLGPDPMREAARLLLRYVHHLGRTGAGLGPAELQAEQWSAMAYLDEHRGQAAREIAAAFATELGSGLAAAAAEPAAVGISAAELARLVRLTDDLAPNLAEHRDLLDYAAEIAALLRDPSAIQAVGGRFAGAGAAALVRNVSGVRVPDLATGLIEAPVEPGGSEPQQPRVPVRFRDAFQDGSGQGPELVWLPGGTFLMGDAQGVGRQGERPAADVILDDFSAGTYPVTFDEYDRYCQAMGLEPPAFEYRERADRPVVNVSWHDAVAYCAWLSRQTGQTYGLLTEAQWEYACRAGTTTAYSFGDDARDLGRFAWYKANSGGLVHPVGEKPANAWSLHDMHGNVWEWVQDWLGNYRALARHNPTGPESGTAKVYRGGSWNVEAPLCRSSSRQANRPDHRSRRVGFRVGRSGPPHADPIPGLHDVPDREPLSTSDASTPAADAAADATLPQTPSSSGRQRLAIIEDQIGGGLRFIADTDQGRSEYALPARQLRLADAFIARVSGSAVADTGASKTLFEMLLPLQLRELAYLQRDLVLLVDEASARFPWEILDDRWSATGRPPAVTASVIREFETQRSRARPAYALGPKALVVGNPDLGGWNAFAGLPGARDEAERVAGLLREYGFQVLDCIDARADAILNGLHRDAWRILHLAGQGVHQLPLYRGLAAPQATSVQVSVVEERVSGMVIGPETFLTPGDIEQMRWVPELVFINCCHLGWVEGSVPKHANQLAANLGEQFIRMGVKAVVAPGWIIDDAAGGAFAEGFYSRMLAGQPFGEAVRGTREEVWLRFPAVNTWGAYQCYGDPDYRLRESAGEVG